MQYQFSSSPNIIHAMHYIQFRNCVEFLRSLFLLTTCPNWMDEAGIYYNNIVYTKSHFKGQLEGLLERKFIIINHRVNNFIINVKFHFESRQMIGQSFAKKKRRIKNYGILINFHFTRHLQSCLQGLIVNNLRKILVCTLIKFCFHFQVSVSNTTN